MCNRYKKRKARMNVGKKFYGSLDFYFFSIWFYYFIYLFYFSAIQCFPTTILQFMSSMIACKINTGLLQIGSRRSTPYRIYSHTTYVFTSIQFFSKYSVCRRPECQHKKSTKSKFILFLLNNNQFHPFH